VGSLVGTLVGEGVGCFVGRGVMIWICGALVGASVGSSLQHTSLQLEASPGLPVQISTQNNGLGLPSVGQGTTHPSKKLPSSGQRMTQSFGSRGATAPSQHNSCSQQASEQPSGVKVPASHRSTHLIGRGDPSVGQALTQPASG